MNLKYLLLALFLLAPIGVSGATSVVHYDWYKGEPQQTATTSAPSHYDWYKGEPVVSSTTTAPAEVAPTIDRVRDWPTSLFPADTVTFVVDWTDANAEGVKMLVCKTDAITAATPACDGGEWASNKDDYDTSNPIEATYVTTASEAGDNNYYVFVCDDTPTCSSSTSGSFTVTALATQAATGVGALNATLNAELFDLLGGAPLDLSFEWGVTVTDNFVIVKAATSSLGTYSLTLNDLTPNTLYSFRANAFDALNATTTASTLTFTTDALDPLTTNDATNIASTSATLNANMDDLGGTSTLMTKFEYGIDETFTATTTGQFISSTGTVSEAVTGLTTFEEYAFRAVATTATQYFGETTHHQFFSADISTSTPVVTADNQAWDNSLFSDGTNSTTTGTTVLTILGGAALEDSEGFNNTFGNWNNDTGVGTNCLTFDTNNTTSGNTGPSAPQEGTHYVYWETSSSACNGSNWDSMTYTLAATSGGTVDFYYHMYGATMGTLTLEAYDGSTWTAFLTKVGQQEQTDELDAWTHVTGATATFPSDTEQIRFYYTGATSFTGDAAVDIVEVNTEGALEYGEWTSVAWDMSAIDDVDTSFIEFSSTTAGTSTVVVKTAVNTSSTTSPSDGSFATTTSGGTIAGISTDDDLTGDYLWVRVELTPDGANNPTLTELIYAVNQGGAAAPAPTPSGRKRAVQVISLALPERKLFQ